MDNLQNQKKRNILNLICAFILLGAFVAVLVMICQNNGDPIGIDKQVHTFMVEIRNNTLTFLAKFCSFFGSTLFGIGLGVLLLIIPYTRLKVGVPFATISLVGVGAYTLVKELVERPRPNTTFLLEDISGSSFPSGHATVVMVMFGVLIFYATKYLENRKLAIGLTIFMALMILLVPISRLYLGAHWVSDVFGGMCLGGFVAIVGTMVAEKIRKEYHKRRRVEDE